MGALTPIFITRMEKKEKYFVAEKKLIKFSEKKLLSSVLIGHGKGIDPKVLQDKGYKKIFSTSEIIEKKEIFTDIILQHPSGFYIYFSKMNKVEMNFQIKVFFTQDVYNDVILFINYINK